MAEPSTTHLVTAVAIYCVHLTDNTWQVYNAGGMSSCHTRDNEENEPTG
jgi:hypothetical protein